MTLARKYSYRRTLPHLQKDAAPIFVTFCTFNRWSLPEAARSAALEGCLDENGRSMMLHCDAPLRCGHAGSCPLNSYYQEKA